MSAHFFSSIILKSERKQRSIAFVQVNSYTFATDEDNDGNKLEHIILLTYMQIKLSADSLFSMNIDYIEHLSKSIPSE